MQPPRHRANPRKGTGSETVKCPPRGSPPTRDRRARWSARSARGHPALCLPTRCCRAPRTARSRCGARVRGALSDRCGAADSLPITDLEGGAVFGSALAPIVELCRLNVGMPEPFLELRDVCFVLEGVCGSRRPQHMHTNFDTRPLRVGARQLIGAIARDGPIEPAGAAVANLPKKRARSVLQICAGLEVIGEQSLGGGVQGNVPQLPALAVHSQVRHTAPQVQSALIGLQSSSRLRPW